MDRETCQRRSKELEASVEKAFDDFSSRRITEAAFNRICDDAEAENERNTILYKSRQKVRGLDRGPDEVDGWSGRPDDRFEFDPKSVTNPRVAVKHKGGWRPPSVYDASAAQMKSLFEAGRSGMRGFSTHVGGDVATKDAGSWADRGDVGMKTTWTQTVPTSIAEGASGSLLPPELIPSAFWLRYEPTRLFDYFIGARGETQSVSWLTHSSNTNPAAAVAELSQKPDLGPVVTAKTATYSTIAALATVSRQMFDDFPNWASTIPHELQTALIDAENDQVLNGNGSSPNMTGLLHTSNTLSRVCATVSNVATFTQIDAILQAIDDLRVGSAYAQADLIVLNPLDWSIIRRIKNTLGSFVLNATEPNEIGGIDNIFGVPVALTTKIASGTAVVLDSKIAVLGFTRMGIEIAYDPYGDYAWQNNAIVFRGEMRETIGVAYPAAICVVTNLNQGSDWSS